MIICQIARYVMIAYALILSLQLHVDMFFIRIGKLYKFNFSLDKWITNDNICPICRRVIKSKIKILFDFKNPSNPSNNNLSIPTTDEPDILQQTISEKMKLFRENKVLKDEKIELEQSFKNLNDKLIQFAGQFSEMNQTVKEYKNKIIGLSYRLEEVENDCEKYKETLEFKEKYICEIEIAKKELEYKIGTNKDVMDLLSKMDDTEREFNLKETISDFLKKSDGVTSLTTFIFVLHQKIKNHQDEIENLRKSKLSHQRNYIDQINDQALLGLIINENTSNINKKRKFAEINGQKEIKNISNDIISPRRKLDLNYNSNTNIISISNKSDHTIPDNKNISIMNSKNNNLNQNPFNMNNKIKSPSTNNIKTNSVNNTSINISNYNNTNSSFHKNTSLLRPPYQVKDSILKK